ncbi:MAG: UbiX family flavin prenyltransferase [Desulfobacteraceae bacterium]|nr:UbiX family flavin prenyltransferase [Desulfobacteraceae bacterium]MBC2756069.1 UbiX family flavin prenyltransferase [Desulfobacteraceae bacterium]
MKKKFIVAITGASGSIYGLRLISALIKFPVDLFVLISNSGRQVTAHETDFKSGPIAGYLEKAGEVFHEQAILTEVDPSDFFAPIASGSFQHTGMVIAPCSMNTLAAISSGITDNLIHRAADVCLKEKRTLVLLPRETPFSLIHLKNMTRAAEAGAIIMPPSPGFYTRPATIENLVDSMVARALDHLHLNHDLSPRWGS